MPVEPSSSSGHPEEHVRVGLASGADHAANGAGIQQQAARIIEAVLADTAPEHHLARELLRRQIAAHPGHPERALLEHLAARQALDGPLQVTPDAPDLVEPDAASRE